jgi:asparagine synthase (glutamine-hydrolysing)
VKAPLPATRPGIGIVRADFSESFRDPEGAAPVLPDGALHGHIRIVVDARIDNELALRTALAVEHATLSELLVRAYLTWGDEFATKLSGDFALVLWDATTQKLLAARDPFGIRPLFYQVSRQEIRLAGSVRQLLTASGETPILNDQRIVEYLLGRYGTTDASFFRHVRELPAGHILIATAANVSLRRYWYPPVSGSRSSCVSRREYHEEFRRLFIESVSERLRSDTPVIIHVSGGLDSSSIACAADAIERAGNLPTPYIRGAAALHPGLPCDEGPFIDAVARRVRFPIERWDATAVGAEDLDLIDSSIVQPGLRALYRGGTTGDVIIARSHRASVILTGTGGDEIGAVVGFVKDLLADHQWASVIEELLFFPGATMRTRVGRLKQVVRQSLPAAVLRWNASLRAAVPVWLAPGMHQLAKDLAFADPPNGSFPSHLATHVWERVTSPRLERVVTQYQEYSSGQGLEYRFPFLDKELVTFVLTVPYEHWPRPRTCARLHREALADLLPPKIQQRFEKADFTSAVVNRIRNAQTQIQAIVGAASWHSGRYVDHGEARRLCRSVLSDKNPINPEDWLSLWSIVSLETWMRRAFEYHMGIGSQEVS